MNKRTKTINTSKSPGNVKSADDQLRKSIKKMKINPKDTPKKIVFIPEEKNKIEKNYFLLMSSNKLQKRKQVVKDEIMNSKLLDPVIDNALNKRQLGLVNSNTKINCNGDGSENKQYVKNIYTNSNMNNLNTNINNSNKKGRISFNPSNLPEHILRKENQRNIMMDNEKDREIDGLMKYKNDFANNININCNNGNGRMTRKRLKGFKEYLFTENENSVNDSVGISVSNTVYNSESEFKYNSQKGSGNSNMPSVNNTQILNNPTPKKNCTNNHEKINSNINTIIYNNTTNTNILFIENNNKKSKTRNKTKSTAKGRVFNRTSKRKNPDNSDDEKLNVGTKRKKLYRY